MKMKNRELKSPSGRRYPKQTRLYTYQGKTLSLKGWARELGIHTSSLNKRFAKFGYGEDALPYVLTANRYPGSGGRTKELVYNGQKTTFKELALQYGVTEGRLRARVRSGWDLKRALTTSSFEARSQAGRARMKKVLERQGRLIEIDGVADTFNAHARRKGLNIKTAKSRVGGCKWGKKEALSTPVMSREEIYERSAATRRQDTNRRRLAALGVVL